MSAETLERKTKVNVRGGCVEVRLGVVGERGGVELAFTCRDEAARWDASAITADGFEVHCRKPMYVTGKAEPDHEDCWFIGGPCWHDGTTSWARDTVLPILLDDGLEKFWPWLEREYVRRFDEIDADRSSPREAKGE